MLQVCVPPVFGNLVCELKQKKISAGVGLGDPPTLLHPRPYTGMFSYK